MAFATQQIFCIEEKNLKNVGTRHYQLYFNKIESVVPSWIGQIKLPYLLAVIVYI